MFMSPASKVILERRSSANFSFTSASSFLMTVRSTFSSPRIASSIADGLAERGHLGLEVDLGEARELPEPQVEDVLGLHVGELEGLGHQARREPRRGLPMPRMRAMTSSMTSTALSRPSTMWARSCAFFGAGTRIAGG